MLQLGACYAYQVNIWFNEPTVFLYINAVFGQWFTFAISLHIHM